MKIDAEISSLTPQLTEWRHDFHRHPELAFEEQRTAGLIAQRLRAMGLDPVTGVGGSGVVATIDSGRPGPSIAFRADMDALPMSDESGRSYASVNPGRAHTCGHDGHCAALLGLAQHLMRKPPQQGRVVLIFQPAEETGAGARAMIADGLLQRFAFDEVYAFHNMPLLPPGAAGVRAGPVLNGYIIWDVAVEGVGGHGAAFYKTTDPLQAAARLAVEISSLVGRYVDPADTALITVGALQAAGSHNIIPAKASLSGTVRALSADVQAQLYARLEQACDGVARLSGCKVSCRQIATVPPCVNNVAAAGAAAAASARILGEENVIRDFRSFPFTDDFALFLESAPGAYLFLGQHSAMCHNPAYDFDDALLPVAVAIFAGIADARLGGGNRKA